jgi:hypothetical protein
LASGYKYGENDLFRSHCQAIILSNHAYSVANKQTYFNAVKIHFMIGLMPMKVGESIFMPTVLVVMRSAYSTLQSIQVNCL